MLVTIQRTILLELLDVASRFVSKNATLPILENIYIKGEEDHLIIRATDMEKYVEIQYPLPIEATGVITVNASTLNTFLKTSTDEEITLEINETNNILTIRSDHDTFTIKGIPGTEYVAVPNIHSDTPLELDPSVLLHAINQVEYAVVDKSFSPVLTGILLRIATYNGIAHLVCTGTDSFRLAEYKTPIDTSLTDRTMIIPKITISDIIKGIEALIAREATSITLHHADNMLSIVGVVDGIHITMTSILIKGQFPDYENASVIPTDHTTLTTISANDMSQAVKKISIFTRSNNSFIKCHIEGKTMTCSSGNTDAGSAQTTFSISTQGDETTFACNGKYIQDFLRHVTSDDITIAIVDPNKPLILRDPVMPELTYVIRPLAA